jgi:hypothetical protein
MIDLIINQVDIEFNQFIRYFRGVITGNELWNYLKCRYLHYLIPIPCESE